MNIQVVINGKEKVFECQPYETLMRVLRREGYFSVRFGSDTGETGAAALLLDGKLMNHFDLATADQSDRGNPFHGPEYIILNQAIGGDNGGDPSQTTFPVRFEVDWVRVYQHSN